MSYRATPVEGLGSRLVAKLALDLPRWLTGWPVRPLLAGNLVMMRKQLLTLRALTERDPLAA